MIHIIRYGTNAEQKYFGKDFDDVYDCIVINANMVAFSPKALSVFVSKKTVDKEFFIDPITHAFQHNQSYISDEKTQRIKRSISNLILEYSKGNKLQSIITAPGDKQKELYAKRPLVPSDFDEDLIHSFTENVISYQKNIATKKTGGVSKYIKFAKGIDPSQDIKMYLTPKFIVAPYFYIDTSKRSQEWLDQNILLSRKAWELKEGAQLFIQIVISKSLVVDAAVRGYPGSKLEEIVRGYKSIDTNGYLLWIDNFSEHDQISKVLQVYISMLHDLKTKGVPIYSLYGSYLSSLLAHPEINLLDGVSHGLEYGEKREVVPVGGGLPMPKYYFLKLHKRINFSDMLSVIKRMGINTKEDFHNKICNCKVCVENISENVLESFMQFGESKPSTFKRNKYFVTMNFATTKAKELSLKHYLENKHKEICDINTKTKDALIKNLELSSIELDKYFDEESIQHLNEWIDALRELNS